VSGRPGEIRSSSQASAASLRALVSVGFVPAGVVFGNSTTHIARPLAVRAESRASSLTRGFAGDDASNLPATIRQHQAKTIDCGIAPFLATYPCPHFGFDSTRERRRVSDHFTGYNWELPAAGAALSECFQHALGRLRDRANSRGAHGVVDVHLEVTGDPLIRGNMEILLQGTAVSVPGVPPLDVPFVAAMSCMAFAKLLGSGLMPVTVSFGAVLLSSWTGCQTRKELDSGLAKEVHQLADALTQARELAVNRAEHGADGELLSAVTISHDFERASKTDYRVGAWASGTSLRRFNREEIHQAPALAVTMEQR